MIGTVLDSVQKLFGKGFLIAAFLPSLLFLLGLHFLFFGRETFNETVILLGKGEWKEASLKVLITLAATYLLAYVVYGIRSGLHNFYQGRWPSVLGIVSKVFTAWERKHAHEYDSRLETKLQALSISYWILKDHFKKTFIPGSDRLAPEAVRGRMEEISKSHRLILASLKEKGFLNREKYWKLLAEAKLLQARQNLLPRYLQPKIEALVDEISRAYQHKQNAALRESVDELRALAEGEWTAAYSDRMENFPKDERWLRPTRLGNVAAAYETYSLERYGITLSTLWPRLYHVTPDRFREQIEEAKTFLDFTVILSFFSLLLTLVAGVQVVRGSLWFSVEAMLLPFLFLLGSGMLYLLAIQAMRSFGLQVAASVDLFRLKLLDELEIQRPHSPAAEKNLWTELRRFVEQGDVPTQYMRFKDEKGQDSFSSSSEGAT